MGRPLIIIGAFPRAAAASALRAGFDPWCCGAQLPRDLKSFAKTQALGRGQYPFGLLKAIENAPLPPDTPVMITGGLENHTDMLEAIEFERALLGSAAKSIKIARDPMTLFNMPPHNGVKNCKIHASGSLRTRAGQLFSAMLGGKGYILKPRASFGGNGVAMWNAAQPVGPERYLQKFIKGTPVAAVFQGDGWSCHLVGATDQIIGDPVYGGDGFRYVGNVGPIQLSEKLRQALMHLGVSLTQKCDLRGVFGVDAIMDYSGNLWPVEVNPRYTDSIEVLERARDISILGGQMVRDDPRGSKEKHRRARGGAGDAGKAIIRAKRDGAVGDLYDGLNEGEIADVPRPGQRISKGKRICTVFARGNSIDACNAALKAAADKVYQAFGD